MTPRLDEIHVRLKDRAQKPATRILLYDEHGLATLTDEGGLRETWDRPLDALDWMAKFVRSEKATGKWIGYLSYDIGRWFEKLPETARDDLRLPLFVFTYHSSLSPEVRENTGEEPSHSAKVESNFTRQSYEAAVARVIEYIRAGDVFQVNLSQRFAARQDRSIPAIYHRLPPAEYGAMLDYGQFALLCNSPELFFRIGKDRRITTRPIKGTRPRLPGMKEELKRSVKDQAELNMIVDLERNDLGRVCQLGSVRVTQPREIETHPTVFHGAATIEGILRPDVRFSDLLRAIFPGGSVTGAPKIRAMEIIDELEPVRRGPYCGAIGYLDSDGTMEFNVAIRTMIAKDGVVHIPVGGGIVADSNPAQEYEETLVKAQAMFEALGVKYP